jgi:Lrp/AsnC family leucine-responsive transcriptional regulator
MRVDEKDIQILALVQLDARMPQAEIGRRVLLSPAAVNERLRKLEQRGIIVRYAALVDSERIGCEITAFVEVFIEHPRFESGFVARMQELPEVLECHHVTGEFSCLLKLKVWNKQALQRLLLDEINCLPGVRQTRTVIALSTSKEDFRLPLAGRADEAAPRTARVETETAPEPLAAQAAGRRRAEEPLP